MTSELSTSSHGGRGNTWAHRPRFAPKPLDLHDLKDGHDSDCVADSASFESRSSDEGVEGISQISARRLSDASSISEALASKSDHAAWYRAIEETAENSSPRTIGKQKVRAATPYSSTRIQGMRTNRHPVRLGPQPIPNSMSTSRIRLMEKLP